MPTEEKETRPIAAPSERRRIVLFRRRQCILPTWQGLLLLVLLTALTCWFVGVNAYNFLALNIPGSGGTMVVEGWATDYTMRATLQEFQQGNYDKLYVIGGPLERGDALQERYHTFAEIGRAILIAEGASPDKVVAVPAPRVPQDRTYTSARALRRYLELHGGIPRKIHLVSEGVHARRSTLLLKMALGPQTDVTVTAVPSQSFDTKHWWNTSGGFKIVLTEGLGYIYARLLFRP